MRTYSGYLLIEDLLDDLPSDSPTISRIASGLLNPVVKVVEEDCKTLVGKKVAIGFSQVGFIDLALGERLTRELITSLLAAGNYSRKVRHMAYCSSKGGVCVKCASSHFAVPPAVGSNVTVLSEVITGSFSFRGDALTQSFITSVTPEEADRLEVFVNSQPVLEYSTSKTSDGYLQVSVSGNTSSFDLDVRTWKQTSSPFISFLSKTYSGSLLGASKMEGYDLPVRQSLLREYTSDTRILLLEEALVEYSANIPSGYMEYIGQIRDPLEKALYIVCLYGIFNDLEA